MNITAALSACWAAVHAFIAASYFYLVIRRRGGDEYLWFALLTSFIALYSLGNHLVATAAHEAALANAQNLCLCAISGAAACAIAFTHQLIARPRDPLVTFAWIGTGVVMVLALAGVIVDPANNVPFRTTWVDAAGGMALSVSPLVLPWAALAGVCGLVTTARALTRPKDGDDLRLLAFGGFTSVAAFFHDVAIRVGRIRSITLLEHTLLLATVLVGWMLLKRFLGTGDELAKRTHELKRMFEERQQVQAELIHQEQLAAVGELSAIIAHEVRNPLAVLKNAAAALRRTNLTQEIRITLLNSLNDESDRLNQLVGDLLTYARPVSLQAQTISLGPLIALALDRVWRATPSSAHVRLTVELEGVPETLQGDRELLERVFINVFENALQAMPGGGSLLVSGEAERHGELDAVRIRVQDSGVGMDTLVRARANEPFFTTKPSGTGLGLAIVSRIVGAHGGAIEYLSPRGEVGTTVSIVLPLRALPPSDGRDSAPASDADSVRDADRRSEV